jgi:hypothetical protein
MRQIIVAGAMALALGGCATVTRGTGEQIQVNSDPQGAEARTSLGFQCITPCTLNVQRKDEFSVTIAKPGYEPQTVPVMTRVAGAGVAGFAGNVLVRPLAPPPGSPRGRAKPPPVAQRPPAPPPVAPVAQAPVEPEPQLSEQDRAMNSRN